MHCYAICKDAMVQNFSFKKIQDILQEFKDITEISGHSGHILKFQEFQDHAQACIRMPDTVFEAVFEYFEEVFSIQKFLNTHCSSV